MSEVKVVNRDFSFNASELEDASSAVSEEIEKEKTPEENTNSDAKQNEPEKSAKDTVEEPEKKHEEHVATDENTEGDATFEINGFDEPENKDDKIKDGKTATDSADWKKHIKTADIKEVAKELGLDDFVIELNEHIKNGGKPYDYIFAKTMDWDKLPDALVIKNKLFEEHPELTQEQIELLFDKKYSQGEFAEEDDKKIGDIMLKTDAAKRRSEQKEKWGKLVLPDAKQVQLPDDVKSMVEAAKQKADDDEKQKSYILNSEATKQLHQGKRVAVELPDGSKFNYVLDKPETLTNIISNPQLFKKLTTNKEGEPNVGLLQKIALLALDEKKFFGDIYNRGKGAGKNDLIDENRNAQIPQRKNPAAKNNKPVVVGSVTLSA